MPEVGSLIDWTQLREDLWAWEYVTEVSKIEKQKTKCNLKADNIISNYIINVAQDCFADKFSNFQKFDKKLVCID